MGKILNLEESLKFQIRKNSKTFGSVLNTEDDEEILEQLIGHLRILDENMRTPSVAVYFSEKPGYSLLEKMDILKKGYSNGFAITSFGIKVLDVYRRHIGRPTVKEELARLYDKYLNK